MKDELLLEREEIRLKCFESILNITKIVENKMTQTGFIERIVSNIDMDEYNNKYAPVEIDSLCKGVEGSPCYKDCDLRSILGMMLYLAGNILSDVAYDIHICARFPYSYNANHEIEVKHITIYFKDTKDKDIITDPDRTNTRFDMYADFVGLYATEDKMDPISVKSRTGVMLILGMCLFYGGPACNLILLYIYWKLTILRY